MFEAKFTLLLPCILLMCRLSNSCFPTPSPNSSTLKASHIQAILDKNKCESIYSSGIDVISNTLLQGDGHDIQTISANMSCLNASLSYRNITLNEIQESILPNGSLRLETLSRTFENGKYCLSAIPGDTSSTQFIIIYCNMSSNDKQAKEQTVSNIFPHNKTQIGFPELFVRKCCPLDKILTKVTQNGNEVFLCSEIAKRQGWDPAIFSSRNDEYSSHRHLHDFENGNVTYGFPACDGLPNSLQNSEDIWFTMLDSGVVEVGLTFWFEPVWLPMQQNQFCLDELHDKESSFHNDTNDGSHAMFHRNEIIFFCNIDHYGDYLFHRRIFGGTCIASAAIVFVLLCIYVAIWEKQNLAGWMQFSVFVSLFFVNWLEGLRTVFNADALEVKSTPGCVILAGIAQYFFFALNLNWTVMCFDLCYTFWKLETTSRTVAGCKRKFAYYMVVSWILPLVVVSIIFSLAHRKALEQKFERDGPYKFAHGRCASPIRSLGFQTQGFMFLLNFIFFILTTLLLWKHKSGLKTCGGNQTRIQRTRESAWLFLKLVIVMGVASLTIPIHYFFISSAPLSTVAICFRIVHFFPCFAVLFIFGCSERNMKLIRQKYPRIGHLLYRNK